MLSTLSKSKSLPVTVHDTVSSDISLLKRFFFNYFWYAQGTSATLKFDMICSDGTNEIPLAFNNF